MPSELLTKYPLPPSSEALESPRSYSDKEERQITDLAPLANTLATNPEAQVAPGHEVADNGRF